MNKRISTQYDLLSQALHWVTAIVVTVAFILGPGGFGRLMRQGVDPATHSDIVWHESLGLLVFALTVLRLIWVALRPTPPEFHMSSWMQALGKLMKFALWSLMLALPITAFLALGSEGHPLTILGGIRLDKMPLIAESSIAKLADWGDVHSYLGDTIMWFAGLHAAAAIFHHVFIRDGVLASMLPLKHR
jgi:cytochrome b561